MDDSWDVPLDGDEVYYGSLVLNSEKFPDCCSGRNPAESLKKLNYRIKEYGWKAVGGWVCAQESEKLLGNKNQEEYWIERLKWAKYSGFGYWKVDWGKHGMKSGFRKMLTELGHKYAPGLVIEHAAVPEVIKMSDVYRTYDVPAIMSIPMTVEKLESALVHDCVQGYTGIINCEDEVYIAAALGCSMGVMRHGLTGCLPDGKPDLSFPSLHRNLKSKLTEVTRAVRWHRIAPAFAVSGSDTHISRVTLKDYWKIEDQSAEIEGWWKYKTGDVIEKSAAASISRGMNLPKVTEDENGLIPYVVAAKNQNGAVSVATLGRTLGREYIFPKCDVEIDVNIENECTLGVFGLYKNLILNTTSKIGVISVLAQDLADDEAVDISTLVTTYENKLIIPGELLYKIGTRANPIGDTSEQGLVVQVQNIRK